MNSKEKIAQILLDEEAVILNPKEPFTWASGIKSPIYCDNRQIISVPNSRREVAGALADLIKTHYPDATVIAGTATAGIPHAAWVSEILDLPMIYVRGKAKDHGRKSQIEGQLNADDKVVLVEDLISTGGSVIEAAKAVEGVSEVLGVVAIFSYGLKASHDNFKEANLTHQTATDFSTLLKIAEAENYLDQEELVLVEEWYQNLN